MIAISTTYLSLSLFFFNDTATTEIYTLSLHDALPILALLLPVQRAAETRPWLKAMIDGGEIFHPLRWQPKEALQLLRDVPQLESAGVVVRMPANWRGNRPLRPQVTARVGASMPSRLGQDALLDFRMEEIGRAHV